MHTPSKLISCCSILSTVLAGCAVPAYDVKHDRTGPTSSTIVERIKCELVDMLRSDNAAKGGFKSFLISGNYVAAMKLQLKVTDTGELAPSLSFPTVGPNLGIGAGFKLSSARSQTFFKFLEYSMLELNAQLEKSQEGNPRSSDFGACPEGLNYNLQGDLGISDLVLLDISSASTASGGRVDKKKNEGEFGGTIEFTLIRNINSAGPTWKFGNFEGPGGLAKLDRTSVNTLTIAFARATEAAPEEKPTRGDFSRAQEILQQQLLSQRE